MPPKPETPRFGGVSLTDMGIPEIDPIGTGERATVSHFRAATEPKGRGKLADSLYESIAFYQQPEWRF